jgi:hypothetical protein
MVRKLLPDNESPLPEIIPQHTGVYWAFKRFARQAPPVRRFKWAALPFTGLFGFLLWGFNEFTSLRGWVHVLTSRVILAAMFGAGVLMALMFVWVIPIKKKRIMFFVTVAVWGILLLSLDRIAPRPSRVAPITPTPIPATSPSQDAAAKPLEAKASPTAMRSVAVVKPAPIKQPIIKIRSLVISPDRIDVLSEDSHGVPVNIFIKNVGQIPASNVSHWEQVELRDAADPSAKELDDIFSKLHKNSEGFNSGDDDQIQPTMTRFFTGHLSGITKQQLDMELQNGKALYLFLLINYRDDSGEHYTEYCASLQPGNLIRSCNYHSHAY